MKTKSKVLVTLSLSAAAMGLSVVTGGAAQAASNNNCPNYGTGPQSTVIISQGPLSVSGNGSVTGRLTGTACGALSGGTQTDVSGKVTPNNYYELASEGRNVSSQPLTIATKIGRTTVVSRYSDTYTSCYHESNCYIGGSGSYTLVGRRVSGAIPRSGSAIFGSVTNSGMIGLGASSSTVNNGYLVEILNYNG